MQNYTLNRSTIIKANKTKSIRKTIKVSVVALLVALVFFALSSVVHASDDNAAYRQQVKDGSIKAVDSYIQAMVKFSALNQTKALEAIGQLIENKQSFIDCMETNILEFGFSETIYKNCRDVNFNKYNEFKG